MADLLPSLANGILPRLGQEPAIEDGFRGWLIHGVYQLQVPGDSPAIELASINLQELVRYVAFDFERFSLASRESFAIADTEAVAHNLAGWPLLKLYYSAFFAAHAILRSQGAGVVKLERRHATHLNSIINAVYSDQKNVDPGIYLYSAVRARDTGRVSIYLEPAPKGGGVHEDFWKQFCQFLEASAGQAIEEGAANAVEYFSGANEISAAIKEGGIGTGAWISGIRNDINYQHKHSVWFPLRKDGSALKVMKNLKLTESSAFRMDISKRKNPISAFANISSYLSCLSYEISEVVARRSTTGRSFGQKWRRILEQV